MSNPEKEMNPTWSSHHWKQVKHVKLVGGVTVQLPNLEALNLVLGGSKNPNIVTKCT